MIVPSGKIILGESSFEINCQLDISMDSLSVLYNSNHSSVAEAEVPAQAISFIITRPEFLAVDNLGGSGMVVISDGIGVSDNVFDGDTVGVIMVTFVSGVFATNNFGDTNKFVTFGIGVIILSPIFELSTTSLFMLTPINPNVFENKFVLPDTSFKTGPKTPPTRINKKTNMYRFFNLIHNLFKLNSFYN